ncbi:MAG TPA: adenosylcobinamide-phosphate synthase CbiB, partial [Candidatus Lustribacter sp.]|nr:adenosylcobinamide-phosphate synthase CbiB [Candidatus Lustribacter sp.]
DMAALLDSGDLPAARHRLSHLCARDATGLNRDEIARAALESIAENTSDAMVAPLLWVAVAGVPGALGYRAANTLDAMVGYRSARYERFGWAPARLDDLLNAVPARVGAALTAGCAPHVGGRAAMSWRVWRRDAAGHPSPNAGQVEAAFAGALGVTLGGASTYAGVPEVRGRLGDGPTPSTADLRRGVRLSRAVGLAATLASAAVAGAVTRIRPGRGRR